MELFFAIMLMLLAVVPAQMLFQKFPKVPLAFYQIAVGLILSFFPLYADLEIPPEVFLLVVISTLMFSDSRKINLGEFSYSLRSTLSLAVNLVIVSVLVVGSVAHWITPELTWFGGFMLAAILSPTDAVAYKSITASTELPMGVDNALENESLLNDASGLVAFNLAVAALTTGHFSVLRGIGNFFYVFIGGIIIGFVLGWVFMAIRRWMIVHKMNINAVIVPYILATPYIIYFVAEELGMSGILAVVAAGLLRTWEQKNWQLTTARIQDSTYSVENIISSVLNGLVFIILGINLPNIIKSGINNNVNFLRLIGIAVCLYLLLSLLRFIWFYFHLVSIKEKRGENHFVNSYLASINGVHGTVTLMMALSIPTTIGVISASLRASIILITAIVIALSMLVPIFVTPWILHSEKKADNSQKLDQIWDEVGDHALNEVQKLELEPYIVNYVIPIIVTQRNMQHMNLAKLMSLYDKTKAIEKKATDELIADQRLSKIVRNYHSAIVNREVLNQPLRPWTALVYWTKVLTSRTAKYRALPEDIQDQRQLIEDEIYPQIMSFLNAQDSQHKTVEVNTLARIYSTRHDDILTEDEINQERYYMLKIFSDEIEYVRDVYHDGRIVLDESRTFIYDICLQQTIYIGRHFEV